MDGVSNDPRHVSVCVCPHVGTLCVGCGEAVGWWVLDPLNEDPVYIRCLCVCVCVLLAGSFVQSTSCELS